MPHTVGVSAHGRPHDVEGVLSSRAPRERSPLSPAALAGTPAAVKGVFAPLSRLTGTPPPVRVHSGGPTTKPGPPRTPNLRERLLTATSSLRGFRRDDFSTFVAHQFQFVADFAFGHSFDFQFARVERELGRRRTDGGTVFQFGREFAFP